MLLFDSSTTLQVPTSVASATRQCLRTGAGVLNQGGSWWVGTRGLNERGVCMYSVLYVVCAVWSSMCVVGTVWSSMNVRSTEYVLYGVVCTEYDLHTVHTSTEYCNTVLQAAVRAPSAHRVSTSGLVEIVVGGRWAASGLSFSARGHTSSVGLPAGSGTRNAPLSLAFRCGSWRGNATLRGR